MLMANGSSPAAWEPGEAGAWEPAAEEGALLDGAVLPRAELDGEGELLHPVIILVNIAPAHTAARTFFSCFIRRPPQVFCSIIHL